MSAIEVAIGPGSAPGSFLVEVVRSPAGEASTEVQLDLASLLAYRPQLQQAVPVSPMSARRILTDAEGQFRSAGQALFTALLGTGDVAGRYQASAALAAERGEGLRVVLRIGTPQLAGLPWEAMYDPATRDYVARRDQLVRQVPVPSVPLPLLVEPPLRVLGVVSSPCDLPDLDTGKEQKQLERALAWPIGQGLVELHWSSAATWAGLHETLLTGPWHVFHFIGHGNFDPARDEGMLILVGPDGRAEPVEASRLADLLRQARPMPRLAVLNSCSGATTGTTDLFSGTAAKLVRSGISAVTAMQFPISDDAAVEFARGFYTAIAHGRGIDDALSSGRVAILGTSSHTLEWATPVLYLRGDRTHLFAIPAGASITPPSAASTTPLTPASPLTDNQAPERLPTSRLGQIIDQNINPFDLEVHRAIRDEGSDFTLTLPPYIEREHDRRLRRVIDQSTPRSVLAVLVGGSSTGKTRSCYEAIRDLKGWRLWHPVSPSRPQALLDALTKGTIRPRTVLWLNELQHYLKDPVLGEKNAAGLRELLRDRSHIPILVLCTLWPEHWGTLTQLPGVGELDHYAHSRELLMGRKIKVPDTFEEVVVQGLPDAASKDERIMLALKRPDKRVAQFLAGAFELLSQYESAPAASHALINAAIDLNRFGRGGALPQTLLREVAPGYLTDYEWGELSKDWLTQALEYTGRPCLGVSGPLARIRPRSSGADHDEPLYELADFLENNGRRSRQFVVPPETFWDSIANRAESTGELLNIAYDLHYRGRYRNAARVYLMAAEAGEIDGLLFLASCRHRVGDNADAETLIKLAIDRGSLQAHIDLAELRHEAGDTESAKQVLRDALINRNIDSDERSSAWGHLVEICEDAGDIRTARKWLKEAISTGDASAIEELELLDKRHNKHRHISVKLISASRALLESYRKIERTHKKMIKLSQADAEHFAFMKEFFEELVAGEEEVRSRPGSLIMLGRVHAAQGNYDTAEAIFLKAINALEEDYVKGAIPALVELMKVLKKNGDTRAAGRLWKYGLEIDGSIADPWNALDQFSLGSN